MDPTTLTLTADAGAAAAGPPIMQGYIGLLPLTTIMQMWVGVGVSVVITLMWIMATQAIADK